MVRIEQFVKQSNNVTSYHPQSNGLVERFHRRMKEARKVRLCTTDWIDNLPLVILSLRTTPKEDIGCSPAELVNDTKLLLPGEFFDSISTEIQPTECLTKLRVAMRDLRTTTVVRHDSPAKSYIPRSLDGCPFVFVRVDSHRTPLQPLYNGPFRVIRSESKHFRIVIQGRKETVSIDGLKPACIDCGDKAVITTRAGRTSKRPERSVPSGT